MKRMRVNLTLSVPDSDILNIVKITCLPSMEIFYAYIQQVLLSTYAVTVEFAHKQPA